MGALRKKKYAVLGDTVNTTGILISGAVLAVLKDPVVVRDRGRVTVKGRGQPVEIYELMSLMAA